MRSIAELLDFLNQKMSMQAIYQPVVILHLLTRDGWATRSNLAQTLSGYDAAGTEGWDRILMDNPKRWLVGRHQILSYDKENQTFRLNFDLRGLQINKIPVILARHRAGSRFSCSNFLEKEPQQCSMTQSKQLSKMRLKN